NEERRVNIITIEDPIEFLHVHRNSIVKQRELGTDTLSFPIALRHALRHDPDVILIGEMRDRDSIAIALTAAATGHLVLSTLHTQTAALAVNRIIDIFPDAMRGQIREQLAGSLQAIVAQQILPRLDGEGRTVAAEVLVNTSGVRNLIREGKEHQLYSMMQTGRSVGMQTMDYALAQQVLRGTISRSTAFAHCVDRAELERALMG
ncbi:MAG: type IV pilus twitching motility protein PilT, partial [Clostridia bacterium]